MSAPTPQGLMKASSPIPEKPAAAKRACSSDACREFSARVEVREQADEPPGFSRLKKQPINKEHSSTKNIHPASTLTLHSTRKRNNFRRR
jgi:hypothetical protein